MDNSIETAVESPSILIDNVNHQHDAINIISPTSPSKKRKNKRNKRRNSSEEKLEENGLIPPSTVLHEDLNLLTDSSSTTKHLMEDTHVEEAIVVQPAVAVNEDILSPCGNEEASLDVVEPPPAPVAVNEDILSSYGNEEASLDVVEPPPAPVFGNQDVDEEAPSKPNEVNSLVSSKANKRTSISSTAALPKPPVSSRRASKTPPKSSPISSPIESSPPKDGVERAVRKMSATDLEAAGNRLYEKAKETKRKLEEKKAAIEDSYKFTPQINSKSRKSDTEEGGNRFIKLHERAKEAQRKKEELREKIVAEQCTFKPQITNKARRLSKKEEEGTSCYENLYKNAREIQAKREVMKQEASKKEEEFTFKPKIKQTKSPVKSRPLYDAEREKKKRLELEQKKKEAELSECTFKPKTVSKKTKATESEHHDDAFYDRLYHAGQERTARLAKLKQEREEQEKSKNTFKPKVSSSHNTISTKPFHERLYDKDHLRKVAAEREQKQVEQVQKQFSFKPQISDLPDTTKPPSTGKSIFERLYEEKDRVKEKVEMSEELRIQKEMEECTFRPQIDPPSSVGQKNDETTPIWERLTRIDKNQIIEERERMKEQLELQDCTFKPDVAGAGSLSPKRGTSGSIFERLSASPVVKDGSRSSSKSNSLIKESIQRSQTNSILKTPHSDVDEDAALNAHSKSIVDNYDTWAASLDEKMKNL